MCTFHVLYNFVDAQQQGRISLPNCKLNRSNKEMKANYKCVQIYVLKISSNDLANAIVLMIHKVIIIFRTVFTYIAELISRILTSPLNYYMIRKRS